MSTAEKMSRRIVEFLVGQKQLPAFKESSDEKIAEAERRLKERLQKTQQGLEGELVRQLKENGVLPQNQQKRDEILRAVLGDRFDEMADDISDTTVDVSEIAREQTIRSAQIQGLDITMTAFSQDVLDDLKDKYYTFCQDTFERIQGDFAQTLANAYEDGVGIDDAADMLDKDFKNMRQYRLERIARTEIQGSANDANNRTLTDIGAEYKQWITAEDDRVRGSDPNDEFDHVMLHGEVRRIDEPFSNGLMHPGDRSGPKGEFINCRCTMRAYIPKPDEHIARTPYYP